MLSDFLEKSHKVKFLKGGRWGGRHLAIKIYLPQKLLNSSFLLSADIQTIGALNPISLKQKPQKHKLSKFIYKYSIIYK